MIAVRLDARDPLPWRVLCEVVAAHGERSSASIAAELLPWVRPPVSAVQAPADPRWARLGLAPPCIALPTAAERAALARHRCEHEARAEARVARLMSRLQGQGLVEPRRPLVACAAWFASLVSREGGVAEALSYVVDGPRCLTDRVPVGGWTGGDPDGDDEEEDEGEALDELADPEGDPTEEPGAIDSTHAIRILTACLERPRPPARLDLGSGAASRAYARLADLGVIHPPSHRWPTLKGVELVASLSEKSWAP